MCIFIHIGKKCVYICLVIVIIFLLLFQGILQKYIYGLLLEFVFFPHLKNLAVLGFLWTY